MIKLAIALAAASALSAGARAADAPVPADPSYTLRDTVVGSMLPKDVVSARVPFDRRYDELTADQKAVLWLDYESPKDGDETPFPETGLRHLATPLMKLAVREGYTGKLIASADVDSKGHARSVTVYKSPDPSLSALVQAALTQESYRPARCSGQPCAMTFMLRLDFLKP